MSLLVDTSGLLVLMNRKDRAYPETRALAEEETLFIPASVVPEADYMVTKYFGAQAAAVLLEDIVQGAYEYMQIDMTDVERALNIMTTYEDAQVGFVDASIVALAERYNLNRIPTFDRRHFLMFKPQGLSHLELLP